MSEKRVQEYSNDQITVRFDPNVCIHSAVCLRNLPTVFDINRKRWIDVNGDSADKIVELVKKCPSGALSYTLAGATPEPEAEPKTEEPAPVVITIVPNGSARIAGKVKIIDLEGNLIMETEKCSLCRCGYSEKKPFCDGTHKRIPWVGEAFSQPKAE
ncbi:MAG: (4Fe-4S)-binding protein [Bacteroidia bacterium]